MKILDISKFKEMLIGGATLLEINKDYVDSLNVFPVPDGDTGTNMSKTLTSAVSEVDSKDYDNFEDLLTDFSKGALKGARGNSGVILSQIVKGISKSLSEAKTINTKAFAKALQNATDVAYSAVSKPKEGTILTVIRYIAEKSSTLANKNSSFIAFFDAIIEKGEEILSKTPDMLPVLKKAGVVDAGGKGLIFVFQGFNNVLKGVPMERVAHDDENSLEDAMDNFSADIHDLENIKFAYCTEYFIINLKNKTTEEDIEKLRDKLMAIGDSVIAIGDLSMVKVHVHTNQPNKALQYALSLGELDRIKIENMLEQNRALIKKHEANKKPLAMVSICSGGGLASIFKELGVDTVIQGGQTMNPSVNDILNVIENVNSDNIIVLPNNKNIILAAEQAVELSSKNVKVVKTVNVPEGIACAVAFDINQDIDTNVEVMQEAFGEVAYGEVTYAVRNTNLDGFDLQEGDIIGITSKKIVSKGAEVDDVTMEVIENLVDEDKSVITLYYGEGVTNDDANALKDILADKYDECDVEVYEGGQNHYFYMISVEWYKAYFCKFLLIWLLCGLLYASLIF